jgi:hypothetical protein
MSDKELVNSINLSGKQRMLSQKMTKEAFLIRLNIDKIENIDKLKSSSQLFDKTLKGLIEGDKSLEIIATDDIDIKGQLEKVKILWTLFHKEIEAIISGKAKDDSYDILEKNNITLLQEIDKVVELYASEENSCKLLLATDINLAGKQRMLTQKMAKDLLFIKSGIRKDEYIRDFKKSQRLFIEILNGLFNGNKMLNLSGTKLPNITKQLEVIKRIWEKHQPVLSKAIKGGDMRESILGLDKIMEEMNIGVFIYTQSVNRQKQRLKFASLIGNFMNKGNLSNRRVNLSGIQRMLTQRITKLALLVSYNIDTKSSKDKLIKFSDLYNQTLKAFRDGDKKMGYIPTNDKSVKEQIALIESEWKPFYKHIKLIANGDDKNGNSLKYLISKNEKLLKVSNDLVKEYESLNKSQNYLEKSKLIVINIAGRERMLTQKMTKEKLLVNNGNTEYSEKLKNSIKLFDDALNSLISGDSSQNIAKPTNKKIEKQLKVVADMWKLLKPIYIKSKPTDKELALILKENTTLLNEMNKMVKMTELSAEY